MTREAFAVTSWQVDVFDDATDQLIEEIAARRPDPTAARELWRLAPGEPLDSLLITKEHLDSVNALVDTQLQLVAGRSAYLCQFADVVGETADD